MLAMAYHQPATLEEVRTLWIGDLQYWVDENYLQNCFAQTGELVSIKIIRNKISGLPEGYGFVEFLSHSAAERVLQTYTGAQMPGTEQTFRLNWASFGMGDKRSEGDYSIFVGDLSHDVTDYLLQETFRAQYPSVRGAKVVTDPNTGRPKGYGFVKFADEMERNRAMTEMNGVYCSSRPMRISAATPKKITAIPQQYPTAKANIYPAPTYAATQLPPVPPDPDITNTTIFIGGLDPNISEEELKHIFTQYGDVAYARIPQGKGCGFVQFGTRASAEEAVQRMHGAMIGQQIVRLSWGRSPTNKQDPLGVWAQAADPNAYYGYGYDAYSFAAAQDPSLYAYGAYAGYGPYPPQVEGVHQEMASVVGGVAPVIMEHREEVYDPMVIPTVDRLNAAYISIHGNAMLGRSLWLKTSTMVQHA